MLKCSCAATRVQHAAGAMALLSVILVVIPPAHAWADEPAAETEQSCAGAGASVPGYGGSYVDAPSTGDILRVHVWLTEPSDEMAAKVRDAVVAACGDQASKPDYVTHAADYTWTQLVNWHRSMRDVLGLPGVVLTDADETRNRLLVGVNDPAEHSAAVEEAVGRLGIPRAAVVIEARSPIRQLPSPTDQRSPSAWFLGAAVIVVAVVGFIGARVHRRWSARRRGSATGPSSIEPDSPAADQASVLRS